MSKPTGELKLSIRRKQTGKTYIAKQIYKMPMQVLTPYYPDKDGTAFIYLLNLAGGIFQGDRIVTEIDLDKDSSAFITTPSAGKLYKMMDDHAELVNHFKVNAGGALEYFPEYNIPYGMSKTYQENIFNIDSDSFLFATDMVIPGRVDRGESFEYDLYSNKTKIYVDNRLEVFEFSKIEPNNANLQSIGIFEGYPVYGSIYIHSKLLSDGLKAEVNSALSCNENIKGGISFISGALAVIRVLGLGTEDVQKAMYNVWEISRKLLLNKPAVRIRRY